MSLLVVQNDREYVQIRRRGRFTLTAEQAAQPAKRAAIVAAMRAKMIRDLGKRGFQYQDDGRDELQGPLSHMEFSEDSRSDMGPLAAPDPRDLAANRRFERDEKTRQGQDVPMGTANLVDFRLIATFRKATGSSYRSLVGRR